MSLHLTTAEFLRSFQLHTFEYGVPQRVLSETSRIFDPIGVLLPVTIKSRILIQNLHKSKICWDEAVNSV